MNESTIEENPLHEAPEVQFSRALKNYRLSNGAASPFDLVDAFTDISAKRALAYSSQQDEYSEQEFVQWDLETKLWHLVKILYSFRLAEKHIVSSKLYSSLAKKREEFLSKNPQVKELQLIIEWLQYNYAEPQLEIPQSAKWLHTKIAILNKSLSALTSDKLAENLVSHMDADAPVREGKSIKKEDADIDSQNFLSIYKLLVAGDLQRAIEVANETGNFTLALIILGARQDFIDPVLDEVETESDDMDEDIPQEPSGLRHKLLWLQSVYKLSREPNLHPHERLIYSFLSGGDITENVKLAQASWEECLLLYLQQVCTHKLKEFIASLTPPDDQLDHVAYPSSQQSTIQEILNTLLRNLALDKDSKDPFRVIMGSVMIDQLGTFLHKSFKSSESQITDDPHILRLLSHLSIFLVLIGRQEGAKTPTRILVRYITYLPTVQLEDLVPIYVSFIPDEKDARECYSLFLSSIIDPVKRSRQLEIFKSFESASWFDNGTPLSSATEDFASENEGKFQNVLKRTVERVMLETEPFYAATDGLVLVEDESLDPTDVKLYRSVDWLYDKNMYEDAISATRVIFRRFLLTGRLKAIKDFAKEKSFKTLLKNYDFDLHTKTLGGESPPATISEEEKEELLQYDKLVETLRLLDEWKQFVQGSSSPEVWKSKDIKQSIEKTIGSLELIIHDWFSTLLKTSHNTTMTAVFREYRSIYIPYFVVELLQVLEQSRYNDWKYMKKAFGLINEVANDKKNDLLSCFINCGRLNEFVALTGKLAVVATEKGIKGIFP